jgi:hypothetical protein
VRFAQVLTNGNDPPTSGTPEQTLWRIWFGAIFVRNIRFGCRMCSSTLRAETDLATPALANSRRPRIGYVPYSVDLSHPADRRRFPAYARQRGIPFEIARPDQSYDMVVLNETADLKTWTKYRAGKIVYELIDSYLAVPRSNPKQLLRGIVWYLKGLQQQPVFDFRGALEQMCRRADAVTCTTEEQQQTISKFCPNVHIALDFHGELINSVKTDYRASNPFKIIWEGLPSNVYQLGTIRKALREVSRNRSIQLVLVTDLDQKRTIPWLGRVKTVDLVRGVLDDVKVLPWEQTTWSQTITQGDRVVPLAATAITTSHGESCAALTCLIASATSSSASSALATKAFSPPAMMKRTRLVTDFSDGSDVGGPARRSRRCRARASSYRRCDRCRKPAFDDTPTDRIACSRVPQH